MSAEVKAQARILRTHFTPKYQMMSSEKMQFSQMVLLNAEIILLQDNIPPIIITGMILPLLHHQLIRVLPITQIMLHMISRHDHFIRVGRILLAPFNELEPRIYQRREAEKRS